MMGCCTGLVCDDGICVILGSDQCLTQDPQTGECVSQVGCVGFEPGTGECVPSQGQANCESRGCKKKRKKDKKDKKRKQGGKGGK
jgi:hypothetical protein